MHGPATILIMAKKKAAGPMGFFDPMAEHGEMAMGPMDMEAPTGGMFDAGTGAMPGGEASSGSIQEALMHLRKAAQALEGYGPEAEATEETEMSAGGAGFSAGGLNAFVNGLNAVMPLFDMESYPSVNKPASSLPSELIQRVKMISEAAEGAGLEDMAVEPEMLKNDQSLKAAASKLRALASNPAFKSYLEADRPENVEEGYSTPAPKAKKPAPAFLKPKPMKY